MAERKTTSSKPKTTSKQPSEAALKRRAEEALARNQRKRHVYSVILFAFGVLFIFFSLLGDAKAENPSAWDIIHTFLRGVFGLSVFAAGPALIYASLMIAKDKRKSAVVVKMLQLAMIILLISGAVQIIGVGEVGEMTAVFDGGVNLKGGGVVGMVLAYPLMFFGRVGAGIIIVLIAFVFIMLMGNITLTTFFGATAKPFKKAGEYAKKRREERKIDAELIAAAEKEREKELERTREKTLMRLNAAEREIEKEIGKDAQFKEIMSVLPETPEIKPNPQMPVYKTEPPGIEMPFPEIPPPYILNNGENTAGGENTVPDETDVPDNAVIEAIENYMKEESEQEKERLLRESSFVVPVSELSGELPKKEKITAGLEITDISSGITYRLPSVNLLDRPVAKRPEADVAAELDANSNKLVETLKSFGVLTKIVGVVRGPSVTRYEIQPAPGVKISKITSLTDDIALNLAAAGVRMEAPIPGKSAVGVEVPNHAVDTVSIRELIDSADFRDTGSNLGAAIGKSISGEIIISDIAKMPHLLIAGTTGSGKSVCVNSIIMSILFRSTPDEVRLIMIDPKSVEFMIYSGIPHLLTPVVTDPKKAAGALKWAVNEMTQRYSMFAENNVRDISGYNEAAKINGELPPMTKIVIFIDELADLMMTAAREVEESICRLAQMARAAGIHLVIATQRPTVNVVTGLIKANIPSRIALKVASQVDSRTIIDTAGADKLLGKGDMLYAPVGMPKPIRVQGCWVSDKEVERVVGFIKDNFDLVYDENVIENIERLAEDVSGDKEKEPDDFEIDDDKLEDAIEAVIDSGKASTSYLQLRLKIGYGRAARMIDIMEKMGIVGKPEGSKPREVLMTRQDWLERKMNMGR